MSKHGSRVPDLLVERLRLGELDPARAAEVRRRLAEEPGGDERLRALDASDAEVLDAYPPAAVAREVARRLDLSTGLAGPEEKGRAPGWRVSLAIGLPALAAAAVLLFVLGPPPAEPERLPGFADPAGDGIRIKGLEPHLVVYRQRGDAVERLSSGAEARPGDLLQIAFVAAGRPHGAVLSIDGRGAVTLHHPLPPADLAPAASAPALEDGEVRLPASYQLDDAPAFERFFLVTAGAPFPIAGVVEAARSLGLDPARAKTAALPLPPGLEATSFLLVKPGSP